MKDLKQITVIGLGLLGGSITSTVLRCFSGVKVVGYAHRPSTRKKARELAIADEVTGNLEKSVADSDIVILASPIYIFKSIFAEIAESLKVGCIVTDVGSTKVLPHKWAQKYLPAHVHYVGSHPIAGSEQRGVEYSRDDMFDRAMCIVTSTSKTNSAAALKIEKFWCGLGCHISRMSPAVHDRIFANVSHLPHMVVASLINAAKTDELKFAGKGFIDTSRVASGPANIWTDILLANNRNLVKGIDRVIKELIKLKQAVEDEDRKRIHALLDKARNKRAELINYKIEKKELL